jgi:hypothetical protein
MPTVRPRHTITETPPVQEALDELRSSLKRGERIDFAELVALGARAKARGLRADDVEAAAARKRFAEEIRARSTPYKLDIAAADEVKHHGLVPQYE